MRDIIVLDDDDGFSESKSQGQRGLSEVQKSRMMQQKQMALARLQAKKLQRTLHPDHTIALPQQANAAPVELGSRSWTEDPSTSTSKGWRAGSTSEKWEQFRYPNQGYHDPPSSGPSSHSTSRNADARWDDIINDPSSCAGSDRSTRVVPNGNQGCWDADFDRDTEDVSGSSSFRQNSAHMPTEVVGEWKSVRKRPAPGSSFGIQMNESSGHFKPSSELEIWQIFKSPKTSPDVTRFKNQIPGYGASHSNRFQDPESLQPPMRRMDLPDSNVITEEPWIALPTPPPKEKPVPSKQQMEVLKAIAQKKSVFVTGSAGTGKSFIVEDALQILRGIHGDEAVFVTASTGLAACAIGGTTLHSFSGVGIGVNETKEQLTEKVNRGNIYNRYLLLKKWNWPTHALNISFSHANLKVVVGCVCNLYELLVFIMWTVYFTTSV